MLCPGQEVNIMLEKVKWRCNVKWPIFNIRYFLSSFIKKKFSHFIQIGFYRSQYRFPLATSSQKKQRWHGKCVCMHTRVHTCERSGCVSVWYIRLRVICDLPTLTKAVMKIKWDCVLSSACQRDTAQWIVE